MAGNYDIKIGKGGEGGTRRDNNNGVHAGGHIGTYSYRLGNINVGSDIDIIAAGGGGASGWNIKAFNATAHK